MNHAGEIRYLARLAAPDVALVNNAGPAHIEFFGSVEAIARAKGEIFEGLKPGGTAVINADDRHAGLWRELAGGRRIVEFGIDRPAAVSATYRLQLARERDRGEDTAGRGRDGVEGAGRAQREKRARRERRRSGAAGAGAGYRTGAGALCRHQGAAAEEGRPERRHADRRHLQRQSRIDARRDRCAGAGAGEKAVGAGRHGRARPQRAPNCTPRSGGSRASRASSRLLTLGEASANAAQAFGTGARHFTRIEDLLAEVENALAPGVTVLVKGSRFMQMERVVKAFVSETGERRETRDGANP